MILLYWYLEKIQGTTENPVESEAHNRSPPQQQMTLHYYTESFQYIISSLYIILLYFILLNHSDLISWDRANGFDSMAEKLTLLLTSSINIFNVML